MSRFLLNLVVLVRRLAMPLAVMLARVGLDKPHNFLRGDIEAELGLFQDPMSISRSLREEPDQYSIYKEISQTGLVPAAFLLHGSDTALLAGFWGLMREAFDSRGRVSRDVREVLAAAVSEAVGCELCVSVHAAFMDGMGFKAAAEYYQAPKSLRCLDRLPEPHQGVLRWYSMIRMERAGNGPSGASFDAEARAELLGTVLAFHYIGGIYPILMEDLDFIDLFMKCIGLRRFRKVPAVRDRIYRGAVFWIGHSMAKHRPQGESVALEILGSSDLDLSLPPDLGWCEPNRHIAVAAAGLLAAAERLAERTLEQPARMVIRSFVEKEWDAASDPAETDVDWVETALEKADLRSEVERLTSRLGLMTALSPWQLREERGQELLGEFLARRPKSRAESPDAALLGLLAWSRLQSSRKFVARLAGEKYAIREPSRQSIQCAIEDWSESEPR